MVNFKSIPFLRILWPYLAGIFYVQQFGITRYVHLVFISSLFMLMLSFAIHRHRPTLRIKKAMYIACLNVFLFLLVFETSFIYDARNSPQHYRHYMTGNDGAVFCTVSDLPVNTGKFTKIVIELNGIKQQGRWHAVTGSSILYLKNSSSTGLLACGSGLLVYSDFACVNPPQNPGEFDYRKFLESKNIFHVLYADSSQVYKVPSTAAPGSFTQWGCLVKEMVVSVLRQSGLTQEAFSICTALLVGYDDEIDDSILSGFSHSGTLHVLSVSGMHTGLLYVMLGSVLGMFDKYNRYRWLRCILITVALLLFALITGFSPSVMRAVLMLVLIMVGNTGYRQGNSYNTLLLSAFLLLLYNPMLIRDVGFLLSYLAVFGIMYLYPILDRLYEVKHKLLRWFWSLSLMSVAATVFTLPVTLYYFHQFPLWFIFSNLVIIPISIVLMAGAALLLLCHKLAFIAKWLAFVMNWCTAMMLWCTELTDHSGYGFIDSIPFSESDVVCSVLFITISLRIFKHRQYRTVIAGLLMLCVWVGISVAANFITSSQGELVMFSVKHKSAYVLRKGHHVYIHTEELSEKEYQRFVKPYLLRFSGLRLIPYHNNLIRLGGTSLLHLDTKVAANINEAADYIIVSHNSPLYLKTSQKNKPLVIADCSNSYTFVKKLKQRCLALGMPFYSVKEQGAISIRTDHKTSER